MSDVQRQLGVGAVAPPGRLADGQLAVDDQIEDPGVSGSASSDRSKLRLSVVPSWFRNLMFSWEISASSTMPMLTTASRTSNRCADRPHQLLELRGVSTGSSAEVLCDPNRNHAKDAHVSTILGTPGLDERSGRAAGASGAVG